ncbi:cytochrome c oxidase assembly protein [Streptacidiphilus melanogenes]|uniref:cytochrome c oxidase assembly protein n=1 Tax=Streptacidiphilus melanogenes TaxID=411235 RepID=UPI0006945AAE|nr:cytochrome c oxidase assembly protein [Streptacidiphilus melanogenes]
MAGTTLAAGYTGPPAWQWSDVVTSWQLEPVVLTVSVVLAALYAVGLVRLRRRGGSWPLGRSAAWFGGCALWIWSTMSGVGVYERVLFTDRAAQVVTLLMIVPLLLGLGGPVSLIADTVGERGRARLMKVLRSWPSRILMFPAVSTALLMLPPWLYYFTPWYEHTMTSAGWNTGLHVILVVLGLAYFWPRLQIDPVAHEYPALVGLFITMAEVIFDAGLGIMLVYGHATIAEHYYTALGRPWGPSIREDQVWGGCTVWALGDMAGLPFIAALVRRWMVKGRAETAAVDAAIDAQIARQREEAATRKAATPEAEADAPARSGASVVATDDDPEMLRPWWLDDPNLAHRFGGTKDA